MYKYALQQSHSKQVNLKEKIFMKYIKLRLTFVEVYIYLSVAWLHIVTLYQEERLCPI